jgi:two-component system NtrC family sensor kinase
MSRYVSSFKRIIEIFKATGDSKDIAREWEKLKIDAIIDDIDPILTENREGIRKIVEIVKNLKDFARTNREGQWERADLNSIIGKVLIVLANEIKYSATLALDLYENLPGIYCMIDEIGQTILNLLINAIYAIKKKFATDLGTITISTKSEGKNVICIVQDNGSGIPENALPKIFEPFFTTKPPKEGSGLGLYLAYDTIVLKHKGDISVESKEGIGTTFTIRIPIHDEQE